MRFGTNRIDGWKDLEREQQANIGTLAFIPVKNEIETWLRKRGKAVRPQLTPKQRNDIKECFNLIDSDGSGSIEADELYEAFQFMGVKLTFKELQAILAEVDRDGSGEVEYPEFVEIITSSLRKGVDDEDNTPPDFSILATAYRRRKVLDAVTNGADTVANKVARQALLDKYTRDSMEVKLKREQLAGMKVQRRVSYKENLLENLDEWHNEIDINYPGEDIHVPVESSGRRSGRKVRHFSSDDDGPKGVDEPHAKEDQEVRALIASMTSRRELPSRGGVSGGGGGLGQLPPRASTSQGLRSNTSAGSSGPPRDVFQDYLDANKQTKPSEYKWTRVDSRMWVRDQPRVDSGLGRRDGGVGNATLGGQEYSPWPPRAISPETWGFGGGVGSGRSVYSRGGGGGGDGVGGDMRPSSRDSTTPPRSHIRRSNQLSKAFLRTNSLTPTYMGHRAHNFKSTFMHKSQMVIPAPPNVRQLQYHPHGSPAPRAPTPSSLAPQQQMLKSAPRPKSVPAPLYLGSQLPPTSAPRTLTPTNEYRAHTPTGESAFFGLRPGTPVEEWPFAGSFVPDLPATLDIPKEAKLKQRKPAVPTRPGGKKKPNGRKTDEKSTYKQIGITLGSETVGAWDTDQFPSP